MNGVITESSIEAFFSGFNPVIQALIAALFTWGLTAVGASVVFFTEKSNQKLLDGMLGFAAGVMIALSFWGLLAPSIAMSNGSVIPAAIGFLVGGFFLFLIDKILPHLHLHCPIEQAEGIKTRWRRSILVVLAITLHNIPEGFAIGVAFGAIPYGIQSASLGHAIALAIGMGLQNLPEGLAVSMPLRRDGMPRFRAFMYGQASGIVEPIAAVIGAALVLTVHSILPYALAFAAGAMIFVVVEELIPESQQHCNADIATAGAMIGFVVMMILDVALG